MDTTVAIAIIGGVACGLPALGITSLIVYAYKIRNQRPKAEGLIDYLTKGEKL